MTRCVIISHSTHAPTHTHTHTHTQSLCHIRAEIDDNLSHISENPPLPITYFSHNISILNIEFSYTPLRVMTLQWCLLLTMVLEDWTHPPKMTSGLKMMKMMTMRWWQRGRSQSSVSRHGSCMIFLVSTLLLESRC